jgi:biotin carboxyl carrier protein
VQGTVVRSVARGSSVAAGAEVLVVESMKMEHAVAAPAAGTVDLLDAGSFVEYRRHGPGGGRAAGP